MEVIIFNDTFKGNPIKIYAGSISMFSNAESFLEACWNEFNLDKSFKKPNSNSTIINFFIKKSFDGKYEFCDEEDKGAFEVYVLDERILERHTQLTIQK